jgi:hypothetical protein
MKVDWEGRQEELFFFDGCSIIGDETKYKVVSKYPNGDAMAIVQNRIGLIGCHPEADKHWYDSYTWMKKHWSGGKHHLLLDFVNKMMEDSHDE